MSSIYSLGPAFLYCGVHSFPAMLRSDLPLTPQSVALTHLDSLPSHNLVLWTDGSVPFLFGKDGSGILAKCSLCGTKATFSFSAGPVCSSFSAEACAILQALCWSQQHQQVSCHFHFFSAYLTLFLSSPPCPLLHLSFYLKLSHRSGRNCLLSSPVLSGYNRSLDNHFSQGIMQLTSWPDGEHYLCPLPSLVVSISSLFRIHSSLFLDWRHTVSSKFFNTQFPSIFTEELVLPCHAHCVLSRLCSNGHSLLYPLFLSFWNWQNQESFLQHLWTLIPGHLLSHSALSSYRPFVLLALWQLFFSLRSLVQVLGSCLASGAPWSSDMPHPSKGVG